MLKFAVKNMLVRAPRMLLVALSVIVSAGVALLAYNVSCQVNEGIVNTAGYYDVILGPAGSSTQLAMNTMFFTDKPLGTIPYGYVDEIASSGLANSVVPFTMGDSYNSARIVGTTPAFLDGKRLDEGDMFDGIYDAVIGSEVAARYSLKVGSQMITSHGIGTSGAEHTASPLTVVGILAKSGTAYDNTVFTSYKTVWAIHGDEAHHEAEEDEEESAEAHEGEVCAILVRTKGFTEYYKLTEYYSGDARLLCINPATVLREVLEQVDTSTEIVYILCGIILIMNILVVTVITILNLFDSKKEITLMRLIGISMKRIAGVYSIQNGILGLVSTCLAMLLSHMFLSAINGFVADMGIVLGTWKVYPVEWLIAAAVFVISVLPTMAAILRMSGRDSISDK